MRGMLDRLAQGNSNGGGDQLLDLHERILLGRSVNPLLTEPQPNGRDGQGANDGKEPRDLLQAWAFPPAGDGQLPGVDDAYADHDEYARQSRTEGEQQRQRQIEP